MSHKITAELASNTTVIYPHVSSFIRHVFLYTFPSLPQIGPSWGACLQSIGQFSRWALMLLHGPRCDNAMPTLKCSVRTMNVHNKRLIIVTCTSPPAACSGSSTSGRRCRTRGPSPCRSGARISIRTISDTGRHRWPS